MSEPVERTVDIIRRIEGNDLMPHVVRLLAEGEPVALDRLAEAAGIAIEEVRTVLAQHPAIEWDEQGRLAGFGLTLNPTPHSFTFKGRTVFGWCASDALIFPVMLQESGIVESMCPVTGRRIRVEVAPDRLLSVDPPKAVVSKVRPDRDLYDIRAEICSLGLFFSSREAAAPWLEAYPDGIISSVEEDFEIHRRAKELLGWN